MFRVTPKGLAAGAAAIVASGLAWPTQVHAQYYGGYGLGVPQYASTSYGNSGCVTQSPSYGSWTGSAYSSPLPAGGTGYGYPGLSGPGGYSPAQRQGFLEGQRYYETGLAPNHRLSPSEWRGFVAGETRAASTPWQLDPIRQQGYREGQIYWETGSLPNRPLTPAEIQGFRAGERNASVGYGRIY